MPGWGHQHMLMAPSLFQNTSQPIAILWAASYIRRNCGVLSNDDYVAFVRLL